MTELQNMAERAKEDGTILFGGEFAFKAQDPYVVALDKLSHIACEIGGIIHGDGYRIKVFPAFDDGFFTFYWADTNKGVRQMIRWTPETIDLEPRP